MSLDCSIVIPIYNEEALLHAAVADLRVRLADVPWSWELLLCENGSRDGTLAVAEALAARFDNIRVLCCPEPNYGRALRAGIEAARGCWVLCDEIDLCDVDFQQRAIALLQAGRVDFVIGSKLVAGANDERPWLRHLASQAYTLLLRGLLDFKGTDTHGLKAFRREALLPIVKQCVIERDVFASELVIRAARAHLTIEDIPVRVLEKRPPSVKLLSRVPRVVGNLARLTWAIRRPFF